MKRLIKHSLSLVLSGALALGLFACHQATTDSKQQNSQATKKKMVTVTTSFLADMVQELAGDRVQVELIIPAGEDPHLYIAQPRDLEKYKKADLLLYHGLHFEGKMVDILEKKGVAVTKNFTENEITHMEEDGEHVIDPHFWFDLKLYKKAVQAGSEALQSLLPEDKALLKSSEETYLKKLDDLDQEIREKLGKIPAGQRYLITPHDAFQYFARSYDFQVMAPQGVSTNSEVANRDLEETANFIVQHKIPAIFAESTTDPARMKKLQELVEAKGAKVKVVSGEDQELFSDSLAPKGHKGDSFIEMYRHNVDLILANQS